LPNKPKKERSKLEKEPLPYVLSIDLVQDDLFIWDIVMAGPENSPYTGGRFTLRLEFPTQYPFKQPLMRFITPVYHPSVMRTTGEVCGAVLGQWGPTLTAEHCLLTVYSLLSNPVPEHPLEEEIAQLLATNRKEFDKTAKKYTKDHAMAM
jgi:ubiquitin-conjugating enzyme E2 D